MCIWIGLRTLDPLHWSDFFLFPFFSSMLHPVFALNLALCFFVIGVMGVVFNRKSILLVLLCLELILLAVNLQLLSLSSLLHDVEGQVFAFFVLTVAAAESAIGLAILVVYYRLMGTIGGEYMNLLRD